MRREVYKQASSHTSTTCLLLLARVGMFNLDNFCLHLFDHKCNVVQSFSNIILSSRIYIDYFIECLLFALHSN